MVTQALFTTGFLAVFEVKILSSYAASIDFFCVHFVSPQVQDGSSVRPRCSGESLWSWDGSTLVGSTSCSAWTSCLFGRYPMSSKPLQRFDEKHLGAAMLIWRAWQEQHVMFREGQMKFSCKDCSKFYVLSEAEYPSFLMSSVKKKVS